MENKIGLDNNYTFKMTEKLNAYLSNIQVVYMNVRGYHWNVTGKHFFVLHEKYEELYNGLNSMADEVAERILMIGGAPVHAYSKYLKLATIPEKENVSTSEDTVKQVLTELKQLLEDERTLIHLASENGDEGTVNLLSDYVDAQEKMIWMFSTLFEIMSHPDI